LYIVDGEQITEEQFRLISPNDIIAIDVLKVKKLHYTEIKTNGRPLSSLPKKALETLTRKQKNLSETSFIRFKTDARKSKFQFYFIQMTSKLRLLAHNKELFLVVT
jgi:hypothetical protein